MFRNQRRFRRPSTFSPAVRKKASLNQRCLSWSNIAVRALVPLVIFIFTVVSYIQQQQIEDSRRQQDQELAKLESIKDQEIANLTRTQDRELAEKAREKEQKQAHDLHYQGVYKLYIEDISTVLFKQQYSNQTFIDEQAKLEYIRSKTLTALRQLDGERKTHLFQFLYENKLLPHTPSNNANDTSSLSLNLIGSDFDSITLKSSFSQEFRFRRLSLPSTDLTNASFVGCVFNDGANFTKSAMSGVNFTRSRFMCGIQDEEMNYHFDNAMLQRADFRNANLCDGSFIGTNLVNANFSGAYIFRQIQFIGANLTNADFSPVRFSASGSFNINNTDMRGLKMNPQGRTAGYLNMNNVIYPNGTWYINDKKNLVRNGNADTKVSLFCIYSYTTAKTAVW